MGNSFVGIAIPATLLYVGSVIVLIFYGVYVVLSIICIRYLLLNRKRNRIVLVYTIISFLVSTIFTASTIKLTELVIINAAMDPIGSAKLIPRLDLLEQVAYSMKIWLADSLLIYRLWVVWSGMFTVILIPSVLYIGTLATGIAGVAQFWQPSDQTEVVTLGVVFHTCSVAINIISTALIAGRLLYQRKLVKDLGGDHSKEYFSASAIFAESGALYSIAGLIYIPLYGLNSPLIYVFGALLEAAAGIAPTLILLRIALGVSVSRKAHSQITAIKFRVEKNHHSTQSSAGVFAPQDTEKNTISL